MARKLLHLISPLLLLQFGFYMACGQHTVSDDHPRGLYNILIEDIWDKRCGDLPHPFLATASYMNETYVLKNFTENRCRSDHLEGCRQRGACRDPNTAVLCARACWSHHGIYASTPAAPGSTAGDNVHTWQWPICTIDTYFKDRRANFGNPPSGCFDMYNACTAHYEKGHCQLAPGTAICQVSCGQCFGDSDYMPWNPIRAQLIAWAVHQPTRSRARMIIDTYMQQFANYASEVHRTCNARNIRVQNG